MENDSYLPQLLAEKDTIDATFVHASKLLSEEIEKVKSGGDAQQQQGKKYLEIHNDKPQKVAEKIMIPIKEFPRFNFVGKLLGPKGSTLKQLQEQTGTKMSILGRGSMKDRAKEEEMRKEGGKYAHLNEALHLLIEVFGLPSEGYRRLATAIEEVKKFMLPEFNDDIQQQQYEMMLMNGGEGGGRGGRGRGSPAVSRGGRGGGTGMGGTPLLPSPMGGRSIRGSSSGGRGGMMSRGAPRGVSGGRGAPRGTPSRGGGGRGGMRREAQSYDDDSYGGYGGGSGVSGYQESAQSYSSGNGSASYADDSYADPYAESSSYGGAGGDSQYYDYQSGSSSRAVGGGSSGQQSYGDYGGDSWGQDSGYGKSGGRAKSDYRQHPYSAPSRGGGRY